MTVLLQRPVLVDEFGIEHRYGCEMPGTTRELGRNQGFMIRRCTECGATRVNNAR
ncbi:hypothetical protein [Timonella senegalensis]|uniref:hypothetical protein n=1 Tax=Timonella senegalensis TaxID=1465825 RepID=UPI00030A02B8|nr:hypothetical protein [Timonella senegalensis]